MSKRKPEDPRLAEVKPTGQGQHFQLALCNIGQTEYSYKGETFVHEWNTPKSPKEGPRMFGSQKNLYYRNYNGSRTHKSLEQILNEIDIITAIAPQPNEKNL